MNLGSISKAIAGAVATGAVGTGMLITVPESAGMPWWGYIIVGVANAAVGFAIVYLAPRNTQ